jgi:hypothetical protein
VRPVVSRDPSVGVETVRLGAQRPQEPVGSEENGDRLLPSCVTLWPSENKAVTSGKVA